MDYYSDNNNAFPLGEPRVASFHLGNSSSEVVLITFLNMKTLKF